MNTTGRARVPRRLSSGLLWLIAILLIGGVAAAIIWRVSHRTYAPAQDGTIPIRPPPRVKRQPATPISLSASAQPSVLAAAAFRTGIGPANDWETESS